MFLSISFFISYNCTVCRVMVFSWIGSRDSRSVCMQALKPSISEGAVRLPPATATNCRLLLLPLVRTLSRGRLSRGGSTGLIGM